MAQVRFSPEEVVRLLSAAARVKEMGTDPVAVLTEEARAEAWVRAHAPEGTSHLLLRPNELAKLLREALPVLNKTDAPDPINSRKFRYSLRGWRIGRFIGTRSEGDEELDTIADLIAVRPQGPGHPERPLYQRLGDVQEWKLFKKMLAWFKLAQKATPEALQEPSKILEDLRRQEKPDPWFSEAFLPSLAQALSRYRRQPKGGALSAREMTAVWLMEYRTGKEPDPEEAIRKVERIRKNVERNRRPRGKPGT